MTELYDLECSVSILHSFEDCKDALDWEIGVHGLRLFFDGRRSTYLPEVPVPRGWSKEQTLKHLAEKAGYRGEYGQEQMKQSKLVRYQTSKATATWEEYQEFTRQA
jgi:AMMECR1 domain-containing protein